MSRELQGTLEMIIIMILLLLLMRKSFPPICWEPRLGYNKSSFCRSSLNKIKVLFPQQNFRTTVISYSAKHRKWETLFWRKKSEKAVESDGMCMPWNIVPFCLAYKYLYSVYIDVFTLFSLCSVGWGNGNWFSWIQGFILK